MRLRLSHLIIQPVLVRDDGDELTPGPELATAQLPLSELPAFAEALPGVIAMLQAQLDNQPTEQEQDNANAR